MATILAIDDIPYNLDILREYLEDDGHQVLVADNGRTGLEMVMKYQPDLVLLDIVMPIMDGREVLRRLRRSRRYRDLPVIMLTADTLDESLEQCLAGGANDYITKPFTLKAVSARISAALRQAATRQQLQQYNEQLKNIFAKESLTGTLNRDAFLEKCREEMRRSLKSKSTLALAHISIDDYPKLVQQFGHVQADELLKQFGGLLQRIFRPDDLVGHLGGEEFAVCMANTRSFQALGVIERLRKNLHESPRRVGGREYALTASIGVAMMTNQISPEALLNSAAEALLRARAQGKDQIMLAQSAI